MTFVDLYLIICVALALSGVFHAVRVFREKMPPGRVRRMGVTDESFGHMIIIYYLVLFEGVYGFVSFILDFPPLWVDVLLFLVIIISALAVYSSLIHRKKFNRVAFMIGFLFPVIIPGFHIVAKLIR